MSPRASNRCIDSSLFLPLVRLTLCVARSAHMNSRQRVDSRSRPEIAGGVAMRFLSTLLLCSASPSLLLAQTRVIDHTKARMYLGEEVIVEGPVARVDHANGGALWFSLGKAHPSSTVVIVVPKEFASAFPEPRTLEGATVRVSGKLSSAETAGIGLERTANRAMSGPKPRSPFIVIEDPSRLNVTVPAKPKEP